MQNVDRIAVWLLLIVMTGPSSAVEPSPIVATGVISEAYGADSSNWDTPPYNAYSFTETDHIFPTLLISPGQKSASTLTYAEQQLNLSKLTMTDPATGREMALLDGIDRRLQNSGLIIIYKNQIVHESYRNNLQTDTRHILMSVSKSLTSLAAQVAVQQGLFDLDELASKYVPELRDRKIWEGVTIRHVWDMRDGIAFTENYDDPKSDIRQQDHAIGWRTQDPDGVRGMRAFIKSNMNDRAFPIGEHFNYSSPLVEVMAMIIESASGETFAEFFEDNVWSRLGADNVAGFATDGYGHSIAQGGISTTLRDLTRVAMLVMNRGKTAFDEQLIDADFFDDLLTPRRDLIDAYPQSEASGTSFYRSFFWIGNAEKGVFSAEGVHGQFMHFDVENEFAMVGLGAYPAAVDPLMDDVKAEMARVVLEELIK